MESATVRPITDESSVSAANQRPKSAWSDDGTAPPVYDESDSVKTKDVTDNPDTKSRQTATTGDDWVHEAKGYEESPRRARSASLQEQEEMEEAAGNGRRCWGECCSFLLLFVLLVIVLFIGVGLFIAMEVNHENDNIDVSRLIG